MIFFRKRFFVNYFKSSFVNLAKIGKFFRIFSKIVYKSFFEIYFRSFFREFLEEYLQIPFQKVIRKCLQVICRSSFKKSFRNFLESILKKKNTIQNFVRSAFGCSSKFKNSSGFFSETAPASFSPKESL